MFVGGAGNDFVDGQQGNDVGLLGAGDDVFQWVPGDGSDTLEGQDGADSMLFFGANIAENIDVAANGGRVRFFRDIANVTMDLDDVESIDFRALGGADNVVVNDLSGTDVTEVNNALAAAGGAGDAQPDNVIVQGTSGGDVALAVGDASGVSALGLAAQVNVTGSEAANDRLTITLPATTSSRRPAWPPARSSSPRTAAPDPTSSSAATATTSCSVAPATTSSWAAPAPTCSTAATVTTSRSSSSPAATPSPPLALPTISGSWTTSRSSTARR